MGKRKGVKKLEMGNQQPSTSSSSSSSGQQRKMAKTKNKQVEKRLKEESKSEIENQVEVENKCSIDDLPPEMLTKILKCLNAKSLVCSRLVSRKWNGIACKVIKSSDNVEIVFNFGTSDYKRRESRKELSSNFIELFKSSREAPLYTRFRLLIGETSFFDGNSNWTKFMTYFGNSIKCLNVQVCFNWNVAEGNELVDNLRNLFLTQLPNLQQFGLYFVVRYSTGPPPLTNIDHLSNRIQLFPIPTTTSSDNEETTAASIVQLPNLKVLYVDNSSFTKYEGIITDLLRASVNLQAIKPVGGYHHFETIKGVDLLQSTGKLHLLQAVEFYLKVDFWSNRNANSSAPLNFKFKELSLIMSDDKNTKFLSDVYLFLSNAFESGKDTLRELRMYSIGFLPALQLPKFSKLTNLTILDEHEGLIQVLPKGLNPSEIFPLLQHLELRVGWTLFFPDDAQNVSSCLPNLKTLQITSVGMTKEDIAQIATVCPNLKELQIGHFFMPEPLNNFPEVGTAIWTHLTKLESLDLKIDAKSPANAFPAVDSTFTGFSVEDVIRLDKELAQVQKGAENRGSKIQIKTPPSKLEVERKNPSILDLKDLKNLKISLAPKEMLIVSEKYAFQLMENLKYEF